MRPGWVSIVNENGTVVMLQVILCIKITWIVFVRGKNLIIVKRKLL